MLLIACAQTALSVIQIKQGATTHKIKLARPYSSLSEFRRELMGKNKYHNLDFTKVTAEELGHVPNDLFMELNELQARQIVDRYKEELARGVNPIEFINAMHQLFATKDAKKDLRVEWLTTADLDSFGFNPKFISLAVLPKKLLGHLIKRWSHKHVSAVVKKELQSIDLKELARNKSFSSVKAGKTFYKNLHSQQTVEHWPSSLKSKADRAGASRRYLNRDLGVSSESDDDDEDLTTSSDEDDDSDDSEYESDEEDDFKGRKKPSRRRSGRNVELHNMRRAASALLEKRI